jgi:hypothetical protein
MYWPGRGKDGRGETENKEETLKIKMELMGSHRLFFFSQTRKIQPPLWKEMNKFRRYFTMLKNVIKGFEEMMNCVLTAMNESLSDPYAGWNEGEELLMLNEVRCGIR